MTLREALIHARQTLSAHRTIDSELEGELLLRHALGLSRERLYSEPERAVTPAEEQVLNQFLERRLAGEPVAYITGEREFWGRDFYVDPRVLIPRPESELLVEKAQERIKRGLVSGLADIGTGCGALAISLALESSETRIYATDVSPSALEVAWCNAIRHGLGNRIRFLTGDLLRPLPEPVDLLIANLPYVPTGEIPSDSQEPRLALDGGADGLAQLRRLCHELEGKLRPGGLLLLEVGMGQADEVVKLLQDCYPSAELGVFPDLAGISRVVSLTLPA